MTDRYERIREALKMGPTPGPRRAVEQSVIGPQDLSILFAKVTFSVGINGSHSVPIEEAIANAALAAACDPDTIRALMEERDALKAENARLRDALHVVSECGDPCKVILYDEEGIEGWRWTHPDGREWTETGEWCEDPPLHPVARAALKQEACRGELQ